MRTSEKQGTPLLEIHAGKARRDVDVHHGITGNGRKLDAT